MFWTGQQAVCCDEDCNLDWHYYPTFKWLHIPVSPSLGILWMIITTSMGSMGCHITSSLTFQLSMPRNLNRRVSYVSGWNWTILDFPKIKTPRIQFAKLYLQLFFGSVGCIVWFGRHVWSMSTLNDAAKCEWNLVAYNLVGDLAGSVPNIW